MGTRFAYFKKSPIDFRENVGIHHSNVSCFVDKKNVEYIYFAIQHKLELIEVIYTLPLYKSII